MRTLSTLRTLPALLLPLLFIGAGCLPIRRPVSPPEPSTTEEVAQDILLTYGVDDMSDEAVEPIDDAESGSASADATESTEINPAPNTSTPEPTPPMTYPVPTSFPGVLPDVELHGKQIRISTAKGDIVFEVLSQEAPKAASNMIALARSGFYDGVIFHRIVPGFVAQGGDPQGMGYGGPGYRFEDEPVTRDYSRGIVAMANSGPDTNGSQFFIVLRDQPMMEKLYTVFGRVTSGMDVVDRLAIGDAMTKVSVEDRR